jgi:hypothetical protein
VGVLQHSAGENIWTQEGRTWKWLEKIAYEELHGLYSSPYNNDQVKDDEMVRACSTYERNTYMVSVRKPQGTVALRRPRPRWEDNIKIYIK